MNTTHESRATVLVPTLRQHNAMQADTASRYARATNTTACVEQQWSDRPQMEMSDNATTERGIRTLETICAVVCIAVATACIAWLATGGMDLIMTVLP